MEVQYSIPVAFWCNLGLFSRDKLAVTFREGRSLLVILYEVRSIVAISRGTSRKHVKPRPSLGQKSGFSCWDHFLQPWCQKHPKGWLCEISEPSTVVPSFIDVYPVDGCFSSRKFRRINKNRWTVGFDRTPSLSHPIA